MIKVAIVCPREPWYPSGQERAVAKTVRYLKKEFDIEIYCTGEKSYKRDLDGINVNVFKGYTKGYRYSPQMAKALKKAEFDIIHAHGFTTYGPYAVTKIKKNVPFIFHPHFHAIGSTIGYRMMRKLYDPIFGKYILKKANKIICVSNTEKSALKSKFNIENNKIVIIPDGIDIDRIQRAKPFDFDKKLILYVGRLEKYKNIHYVIEAIRYLPSEYLFYIIGNGTYGNNLIKLIRELKLDERIKILSNVSDDDVYRWLKTCSIFITLSDIEAFGITVLEALAAERPVIVNNKEGLAELAIQFSNAIFSLDCHRTTPWELANFILKKSQNPVRINLEMYDLKRLAEQLSIIYQSVQTAE